MQIICSKLVPKGMEFMGASQMVLNFDVRINFIFYYMSGCKENIFLKFFNEMEGKISIKVKMNSKFNKNPTD